MGSLQNAQMSSEGHWACISASNIMQHATYSIQRMTCSSIMHANTAAICLRQIHGFERCFVQSWGCPPDGLDITCGTRPPRDPSPSNRLMEWPWLACVRAEAAMTYSTMGVDSIIVNHKHASCAGWAHRQRKPNPRCKRLTQGLN